MTIAGYVSGIGVLGPGLASWPDAAEVLAGRRAYKPAPTVLPAPALLPPTERRRTGRAVKTALAVAWEAIVSRRDRARGAGERVRLIGRRWAQLP